jgi:predicted ATPase/DNA-binding SARP family transcriptional activator
MAQLSLLLLGPPQILLGSEPLDGLKHDKVRALLAYLAVEAGRPHRRDSLVGILWPDFPQTAARNSLRQALAILRQALGDQVRNPPFLLTSRDVVQFNQESDYWLDVAAFSGLLAAARRHGHRRPERCRSCAQRLQQAVDLYQGHFLQGFFLPDSGPFDEWALLTRETLHQEMLVGLAWLARYHRQRGEFQDALKFARRQVTLDPLREEAHREVMRLSFLTGERSVALAQYEMCRRLLAEELGVEPEPETQALYHEIRSAVAPAPSPAKAPPLASLPAQPTPFVGRAQELAEIGQLLEEADCRLLTLTGPGGIGKTRLALKAAARQAGVYADGIYFVPLAALPSPTLLAEAIAAVLEIKLDGARDPASQLLAALSGKEMLLLVDNFEHLLDGALLLADILQHAPGIDLLATSRERLDLRGEWTFLLDGLPVPESTTPAETIETYDAVELFVQSARRADVGFVLDQKNADDIARVCRLVAGLPLAIELAAAWVRSLSCAAIADQLQRSLTLLQTTLRDIPERHRTLKAAFDHSWNYLDAAEQSVLARLSVFQGGFALPAAATIAGATRRVLSSLVEKSLVLPASAGRYSMHALLRQCAAEKLAILDPRLVTQTAHFHYHLQLAERAAAEQDGAAQIEALDQLEAENDNLRAALSWAHSQGLAEEMLRLCVALYRFWYWRNHYREGSRWLQTALAASETSLPLLRAQALRAAGVLALELNDYEQAEPCLRESLALYRQLGDLRGAAATLNSLGAMAFSREQYGSALSLLEESLRIRRKLEDQNSLSTPLNNLGLVALAQGETRRAQRYFEEALALDQAADDTAGAAVSLGNLAAALLELGEHTLAQSRFAEALGLFQEVGDKEGIAECLEGLAAALAYLGMGQRAALLWGAAESIRQQNHAPVHPAERARYDRLLAAIAARLDEPAFAAARHEGQAMPFAEAIAYALSCI